MPRGEMRRTVEVPAPLYDQLKALAERDGTTIAATLQGLVADGLALREHWGQLDNSVRELRQEVRRLADRLE